MKNAICDRLGIEFPLFAFSHCRDVVAAVSRYEDGRMLPDVERPIPYGAGKVTALRARVGDVPIYAAFGDNLFDLSMLSSARVPVAVRPKPRLRERATDLPALVELSREE